METSSYCTVSAARRRSDCLWVLFLTAFVLLVHGYHPLAEDGGLYVAGVQYTLHPTLFPRETAFVTEHLRFSLFAPVLAALVRLSHLSLASILLASYLATTALMLFAASRILDQCFASPTARRTGLALLAATWTAPVAGTSLLLMDPYVTARSFSTPLTLFALAVAMRPARKTPLNRHPWSIRTFASSPIFRCALLLLAAAAFHPLMAGYGLGLVIALRLGLARARFPYWATLTAAVLLLSAIIQLTAKPDSAALRAAADSRYYWFLSQWHWYERLGLLGPLLVILALARWRPAGLSQAARALARASIFFALLATTVTVLFAQEHLRAHAVARLQPLRAFLLIYVVLFLFLGGALGQLIASRAQRLRNPSRARLLHLAPILLIALTGAGMFLAQRDSFPSSPHIEFPGRNNPNPWVQAFLWARAHTPPDALFALDARYVNTQGEDAQTFRAIAQRSAVPDFSKDGGEAAISPSLAPEWQRSALATQRLSQLSDAQRDSALRPLAVGWVVLHASAHTAHPCPFQNAVVKVCDLRSGASALAESAPIAKSPATPSSPQRRTGSLDPPGAGDLKN